ncbi:Bdr family repetitive protein [Borrelia hermsii]|nr:Bdr family repetitive protein [Borrelia hermsii]
MGLDKAIAHDLSRRYYHNEFLYLHIFIFTYKNLESLEKQFNIKFENWED